MVKPLNNTQKLYIKQVTNEDEAWREIQDNGYWLDVSLQYDTDIKELLHIKQFINYFIQKMMLYEKLKHHIFYYYKELK